MVGGERGLSGVSWGPAADPFHALLLIRPVHLHNQHAHARPFLSACTSTHQAVVALCRRLVAILNLLVIVLSMISGFA